MEKSKEEIITAFEKKILGIRNYAHEKGEFFVTDFLNLKKLDYFLGEVVTGESDITPAGKAFLEKYYGFEQIAKLLFEQRGMFNGEEYFKSEVEIVDWFNGVVPMEVMTFIETARGNIEEGATLHEDLLPPKDY